MSYCVECGVKLAPSEPKCPLCGTPVLHPEKAWEKPESMPYPNRVEPAIRRIDRLYARRLSVYLLLVPAVTVLLLDLIDGVRLYWSLYVTGALAFAWCWLLVPVFYKFKRPYAYIAVDAASAYAYLLLIAALTDGLRWYLGLVLPLLVLLAVAVQLSLLAARRLELRALDRTALIIVLAAVFLIGLEFIVDLYAFGGLAFSWSVYAAIPILVIAGMFVYLQRNAALREEIRKRLFL